MENLYGHETGNGGYCQGNTYCNSPFLDPTIISQQAGFHWYVKLSISHNFIEY
jgi:hypothetical protein